VNGSVCATSKVKLERNDLASIEVRDGTLGYVYAMARKIGAGGSQRLLHI
jgi:hypothetical protein